ncbi:M23 family metallopeptidase [Terrihalobacillus insolitus]|uniref:M23 family metallopeptidase n=1 Tax=Terrihalobacillus insolitus TaxID=2950438 RepID=UPI00233FE76F|nr:M23 family metallopeptidase [Terrihalobacillus insolitus]MDC3411805.1 M23 family metallopeptidase [Terrihalobacillus insolitus]
MREENKNVSKNGWKRIFGKKWFFPAVYLTLAALLLTGVLWYQNLGNQVPEASEDSQTELGSDSITRSPIEGKESKPVLEQQEVVKMPVAADAQTKIVTKFYDRGGDAKDQEQALVLYNNKYYQSTGIDIASEDGKGFDVTASLSGTVSEVKEDPLLGNIIKISHNNDVSTYYASLGDVLVEEGAKVEQGDVIGTAGQNLYGQASDVHVHFEIRKGDTAVNPEDYFNQSVSALDAVKDENAESTSSQDDGSDSDENVEEGPSGDLPSPDQSDETDDTDDTGSSDDSGSNGGNSTDDRTESSAAMANA